MVTPAKTPGPVSDPVVTPVTTPVTPAAGPAKVDYSDKDADIWLGLAIVLVAIVAVVALAAVRYGCCRAPEKAPT